MIDCIMNILIKYLKKNIRFSIFLSEFFGGKCVSNINMDILNPNQKRVLICYLEVHNIEVNRVMHANVLQAMVMIKFFIDFGFCVDVCDCQNELAPIITKDRRYDIIIGQGNNFKTACIFHKESHKILYVTESLPSSVQRNYQVRKEYFEKRHPSIDIISSPARSGFFDDEMFTMADSAIVMSSLYNIEPMRKCIDNIYPINCNTLINGKFIFDEAKCRYLLASIKKRFLWFGSKGFIHKGCDIVLDVFREMSEFTIDFYGLDRKEKKIFNQLKSANTNDCGFINVQSKEFVDEVVYKHCFLIFPSCAEGMCTSVATCMAHGIIPIVTKETGFDPCEWIIELRDYKKETIIKAIYDVVNMSDDEIIRLKKGCIKYALQNFSIGHFDKEFRNIMAQITNAKS